MENPGTEELKRILNCMTDYEYDETYLEPGDIDGDYKFRLIKRLHEDDTIKVTIDFPTVIDNKYTYTKNGNGYFLYDDVENSSRAHKFIKKLITHNLTKKGGKKKKQRKTKKTKKNKKINNYTF